MEIITEEQINEQTKALITHDVKDAVIAEINDKARAIVVKDWQDEEAVTEARKYRAEVNKLFNKLDTRRKDVKNLIEKSAQEVLVKIKEPLNYLDSQIAIRADELKRQKEEKERAEQAIIDERERLLAEQGADVKVYHLHKDVMSDEQFGKLLDQAKETKKLQLAEQERLETEARAKDEELAQLRAQNALLEKRAEQSRIVEPVISRSIDSNQIETMSRFDFLMQSLSLEMACNKIIKLEDELAEAREAF